MALILDLVAVTMRKGPLVLGGGGRARLEPLIPIFEQVSRETRGHPRGPIPATLLMAIAWTESAFRPSVKGPALAGGRVAVGLMQVLNTHVGRAMYGSIDPALAFTLRASGLTDPLTNVRAGAWLLFEDFAYGTDIWRTLAAYGGFVKTSPRDYIGKVQSRYFWLWARRLTGRLP